jgi:hypothetical protein
MNSEKKNEIGANDSNGGVLKIGEPAALPLKRLERLHSAGPVEQEALDVEAAQIAHKKLPPQGYDLVVQRRRDELARLLIKIRRGEAGYDLVKKFLLENKGLPSEREV